MDVVQSKYNDYQKGVMCCRYGLYEPLSGQGSIINEELDALQGGANTLEHNISNFNLLAD